jgi:hypothetical protein
VHECRKQYLVPPRYYKYGHHQYIASGFHAAPFPAEHNMPPPSQKSTIGNLTLWEKQEVDRIGKLSDRQVLRELKDIMRGRNYSWVSISRRLQDRLNKKLLDIEHFEPGNIPYEWNVLCDEKVFWTLRGRPSFKSFRFNRACLVNLKIIPTQAGFGPEGGYIPSLHQYY